MKVKQIVRTLFILGVLSANIGCDQVSKNIARQKLEYHEQVGFMNNYVTFMKVENSGAFLSLGNSLPQPLKILLLTVMPLLLLALAAVYLLTKRNLTNATMTAICFIVGGGIGNIYDRLLYGSVTDFLHIDFVIFKTGIFNMADVSIMTGTLIILVDAYLGRTRLRPEAVEKEDQ